MIWTVSFFVCSGVDFQMKTLIVDGEPVLLQLWDTAGQERCVLAWMLYLDGLNDFLCGMRNNTVLNWLLNFILRGKRTNKDFSQLCFMFRFRSIAKSYFRRADGVLLLYDVTCEKSFLNVREWVDMIEVRQHTSYLSSQLHLFFLPAPTTSVVW